ncbi:MAG: MraY family glycosyltransferase, partial [bacterium]|nr:MraY family glycosyltransferase [bacterium]
VEFLTNPFGDGLIVLPMWASFTITILWVVGVTNLINFMDGLDGLASGIVFIASTTMALVSFSMGRPVTTLISLVLAGGSAAFFRYNFRPARIFMGDAGAYFLGFMLAALSIDGAFKSATLIGLAVPFVVLGLPISDTLVNIVRRAKNGQPVYVADKGHYHHRLIQAGLTQTQTVLIMFLISLCFSLTALVMMYASRR